MSQNPHDSALKIFILSANPHRVNNAIASRQFALTGRDYSRKPDVCVNSSEAWSSLKANKITAAVLLTSPILVVEVVSTNRKDDYVDKVEEYQGLGIPEYWIVDGRDKLVSVLLLDNGRYHRTEFRGSERIISRVFTSLVLTAEQVLSA